MTFEPTLVDVVIVVVLAGWSWKPVMRNTKLLDVVSKQKLSNINLFDYTPVKSTFIKDEKYIKTIQLIKKMMSIKSCPPKIMNILKQVTSNPNDIPKLKDEYAKPEYDQYRNTLRAIFQDITLFNKKSDYTLFANIFCLLKTKLPKSYSDNAIFQLMGAMYQYGLIGD